MLIRKKTSVIDIFKQNCVLINYIILRNKSILIVLSEIILFQYCWLLVGVFQELKLKKYKKSQNFLSMENYAHHQNYFLYIMTNIVSLSAITFKILSCIAIIIYSGMIRFLDFVLILALVSLTSASIIPCSGQNCGFPQSNTQEPLTYSQVISAVDQELRTKYKQYLEQSIRLYQSNLDTPQRLIMFFVFRNYVGTFFVIASWDKQSLVSKVNTFIKLGNGFSQKIKGRYTPIDINPIIISLQLSFGEHLIKGSGDAINPIGARLIGQKGEQIFYTEAEVDKKLADIQEFSTQDWFYLKKASIVNSERIITDKRIYGIFTYVTKSGIFLAVGSIDINENLQLNTLVRISEGSTSQDLVLIETIPQFISLESQIRQND